MKRPPLTLSAIVAVAAVALLATAAAAFHQPVHDLNTEPADLTVLGVNGSDQLGWVVASGDFTGDGIDDFLITARLADPLGTGNAGAAYVIFGPRTGTIDLAQCPGNPNHCADVVIQGADTDDQLGFSAATANFNDDAYDDILVASWNADGLGTGTCVNANGDFRGTGDRCSAGEAYVVLGSPSLGGPVSIEAGQQDFTIYGAATGDQVGVSSAAGDINGDGFDDILLGATSADPGGRIDAGEAYVVFGSAALSGSVDLAASTDTVIVQGDNAGDLLGGSVGAGDISGDGVADLLLGAHFADPNGRATAGIVYGLSNPQPGTIDLNVTTTDLSVLGADAGDVVGLRASGVDFNGDGQDDLYLDARFGDGNGNAHANAGEAYVLFGPRSGEIDLKTTTPDFTIFGADSDDRLRSSLDAGDFNGDGIDDLAASSFFADGAGTGTSCGPGQVGDSCEAGETYIVYGPRTGTLDLASASADRTVLGAQAGDNLGRWLSAGDFDSDGIDDLLVGSIGADPGGRAEAGEAYVLFAGSVPQETRSYAISGTSNGVGWSWLIRDGSTSFGGDVPDNTVPAGGTAADLTDAFVASINSIRPATAQPLSTAIFSLTFNAGFEFLVGPLGSPTCVIGPTGCQFNPTIKQIFVGGTTELIVDGAASPGISAEGSGSSLPYVSLAGVAAAAVALAALGWRARRRWLP